MRTVTRERLARLADLGGLSVQIRTTSSRKEVKIKHNDWVERYNTLKEAAAFCRGYVRGLQDAKSQSQKEGECIFSGSR